MPPMKGRGASSPSGSGRAVEARRGGRAHIPTVDMTVDEARMPATTEGGHCREEIPELTAWKGRGRGETLNRRGEVKWR